MHLLCFVGVFYPENKEGQTELIVSYALTVFCWSILSRKQTRTNRTDCVPMHLPCFVGVFYPGNKRGQTELIVSLCTYRVLLEYSIQKQTRTNRTDCVLCTYRVLLEYSIQETNEFSECWPLLRLTLPALLHDSVPGHGKSWRFKNCKTGLIKNVAI